MGVLVGGSPGGPEVPTTCLTAGLGIHVAPIDGALSAASLASLPPLRLAPVMSPSPAVGRPRYQNKRTRSNSLELFN